MQVSNLKSYLAETGMSIKQLSELTNYSQEYLRQIARGKVLPSFRLSRDIFRATNGVINLPVRTRKPKVKIEQEEKILENIQ